MEFKDIAIFLTPLLLIGFGYYIKTTKNPNWQNTKYYWKILVVLGIIVLVLKVILLLMK